MFVIIPSERRIFVAFNPSMVMGTFIVMYSLNLASSFPSLTIPSQSRAVTSALTGPLTISQISFRISSGFLPVLLISLARSVGFVVTPSSIPHDATSFISSTFAVSIKIFIETSFLVKIYPNKHKIQQVKKMLSFLNN